MKRNYIFSADVIRVLAIAGVVTIHTINAIQARPDFAGGATWWMANVLESVSRASIPLFILLSGYFILNKDEGWRSTFQRIFWRIGIPYAAWLYVYEWWGTGGHVSLSRYFDLFFSGGAYHLYFLVILIGLYFVSPFIRKYFKALQVSKQRFVALLLILLGVGLVTIEYLFYDCSVENFFNLWIPFLGYFVGGYFLGHKKVLSVPVLILFFVLGLGVTMYFNYSTLLAIGGGGSAWQPALCRYPYFDNFLSPSVALMSVAAFALLFHMKFDRLVSSRWVVGLVKSVARASFGIYLVHLMLLEVVDKHFFPSIDIYHYPLFTFFVVRFLIVFLLSYLIAVVLRRVPLLKVIVGER